VRLGEVLSPDARYRIACARSLVETSFVNRALTVTIDLGQQSEHQRPRRLVTLQVDQQLAEDARLRVALGE
jgi:hypothetical protein